MIVRVVEGTPAYEQGLNPRRYPIQRLAELMEGSLSDARKVQLEILLSDAVMRYAYDVGYGATPREHEMQWGKNISRPHHADVLAQALQADDLEEFLQQSAPPPHAQYRQLKALLKCYREIEEAGGWPVFKKGKVIKPGKDDPRIPSLREILRIQGDLKTKKPSHAEMLEAVERFQTRHGIEADGVIGPATQLTEELLGHGGPGLPTRSLP